MLRTVATLLVLVAAASGCGGSSTRDKVIYVADNDAKMNAAIENARATVDTFTAALKSPKPDQGSFAVKYPCRDGKTTEHMWLSPVRFDGTKFIGTVNNDPQDVSNVKIGDEVSVEPAKISDWMFVENGKLVGGYTLRVLRDAMSPVERAEFDRSVGFTVE
jgi:uncharacterized protein YegJ (DUF2314 family)